mgnify:CR=1 FL=1
MSTRKSKNFNYFLAEKEDSAISDRVLTCDYRVFFRCSRITYYRAEVVCSPRFLEYHHARRKHHMVP